MDRRWMLADAKGNFISQRQFPGLALFQADFQDDLTIKHLPSGEEYRVQQDEFTEMVDVQVWGTYFKAHSSQDSVNKWLSDFLEEKITLVYMDEEDIRKIKSPKEDGIVSFADGYPALLTTEASLADLNSRMDESVAMDRFRTNIVIDGENPFEEDDWEEIKIGSVRFKNAEPCARCKVINVDQETGVPSAQPLRALSSFRKKDNLVYFGINLIPLDTGIIHEGDLVEVIK